jgi:hypothetical protein
MPSEISYWASMENVSRGGRNRNANAALGPCQPVREMGGSSDD